MDTSNQPVLSELLGSGGEIEGLFQEKRRVGMEKLAFLNGSPAGPGPRWGLDDPDRETLSRHVTEYNRKMSAQYNLQEEEVSFCCERGANLFTTLCTLACQAWDTTAIKHFEVLTKHNFARWALSKDGFRCSSYALPIISQQVHLHGPWLCVHVLIFQLVHPWQLTDQLTIGMYDAVCLYVLGVDTQ